jgi:Amt family ammonium transporter
MGVATIAWVLLGFTLSFGKSTGFIGGFDYLLGQNISTTLPYPSQSVPMAAFMLFQMMFAIITPALISGAISERMKFSGYVLFTALWSLIVYAPIACWVWNPDGWLNKLGVLDFAGGSVVHLSSGVAALAACLALGARKKTAFSPHNIPFVLLGAGLLWVGWIGFNAGSALAINGVALGAFVATQVAAAAGLVGWSITETILRGKPSAIGAGCGLVAGLATVTPAAGYIEVGPAILIGLVASVVCCLATSLKTKFRYDDALDVVGVHGVGGFLGMILTGVFASVAANAAVAASLQQGRAHLILMQALACGVVVVFSFVASFVLMKLTQAIVGVRVSDDHEDGGLDLALHGESAYQLWQVEEDSDDQVATLP